MGGIRRLDQGDLIRAVAIQGVLSKDVSIEKVAFHHPEGDTQQVR